LIKLDPKVDVVKIQDKVTYSKAGEVISYTLMVRNTGNVTLNNVKVDDPLTGFSQTIPLLEPGKETTFATKYTVKQADLDKGSIENKVNVTSKDPSGKDVTGTSTVIATAVKNPSIKVDKVSDLAGIDAQLGRVITYTLTVTNTGNLTMNNVVLRDTLTKFTVNIGTLNPGDLKKYTTTYLVTPADESMGKVTNSATAFAEYSGGSLSNRAVVTDKVAICELFIPEIFTPNGDGIQDYFRIRCIEKYPDAKIIVFNRWGNRVYTKEHYGNTNIWGEADAWWDGYSDNKWTLGKEKLPAGTYYYILYLNDGSGKRNQGYLYLNTDNIR
jgi:gliding motility-associated-like protein/uncharacterized repeat protein (TIGR01451 family)